MKRKISVALAAALIAVLLCAAALAAANRWGMLDFVNQYAGDHYIPEDAQSYVQSDVLTLENDTATVTIRELYYDGRTSRMIVDVTPKDAKTLLLGTDMLLEDRWQNMVRMEQAWDSSDERTVYDYYVQNGCTSLYSVNTWTRSAEDGSIIGGSMDYNMSEDGTLTFFYQEDYADDLAQRDVTFMVGLTPYDQPVAQNSYANHEKRELLEATLTLTAAVNATSEPAPEGAVADTYVNVEPIEYASIGVRVDRVLIQVKPQEIYATIDFTVVDPEAYASTDDGLWFEFIDPQKPGDAWEQRLTDGLSGGGGVYPIDETHYQQRETLGKNELHKTYTLRAYECWEKERFETFEVKMRPATQEDIAAMFRFGEETGNE